MGALFFLISIFKILHYDSIVMYTLIILRFASDPPASWLKVGMSEGQFVLISLPLCRYSEISRDSHGYFNQAEEEIYFLNKFWTD